jgi:hypothetical protein
MQGIIGAKLGHNLDEGLHIIWKKFRQNEDEI